MGDLDLDGDLDLVSGNLVQNGVYLNDGSGTFANAAPSRLPRQGLNSEALLFTDVDADGDQDLVLGCEGELPANRQNRLFVNDGTGLFRDATISAMPVDSDRTRAVVAGDVDRDGDVDLVLGNLGSADDAARQNRLYVNDGSGRFVDASASRLPLDSDSTAALALGDVDRDGDPDLVVGNGGDGSPGQNRLYLNDGTGTYRDGTAARLPLVEDITRAVGLGDLDGDRDLDLVFGGRGQTRVYLNDGSGFFADATASSVPVDEEETEALVLADVDRDGDLDLVLGNSTYQSRLYVNDGSGRFQNESERLPRAAAVVRDMAAGVLWHDGVPDLVFISSTEPGFDEVVSSRNDGSGRFGRGPGFKGDWYPSASALALGDVDGDGDLDVAVATSGAGPPAAPRLFVNKLVQLTTPFVPVLSNSFSLRVHAIHAEDRIAYPALSSRLAPEPMPLPPFGNLHLPLDELILLRPVAIDSGVGRADIAVDIPLDPSLLGRTIYAQALIMSPYDPWTGARLTGHTADVILK